MRRSLRPMGINSKKNLQYFLKDNPDELPFSEECWESAVEETRVRNDRIDEVNSGISRKKNKHIAISQVYFELVDTPYFQSKLTQVEEEDEEEVVEEEVIKEVQEKPKRPIDLKRYITDKDSDQSKFIIKFINTYFGNLYDVDTVKFLISRIKSYYGEYELNSASDEYLVMTAISDELIIRRMNQERIIDHVDNGKDMKVIRDSYMNSLDGLRALKKFNQDNKENENKFSIWVDKLVSEGLIDEDVSYPQDEIDFVVDTTINTIRKSL